MADPGCIEVFAIDDDSFYGHIKSGDSLNFHPIQYHARILSELLDNPARHFIFSGCVATESSRSPRGWSIHLNIYGLQQDLAYLMNHLRTHHLDDLIEWVKL